MRCMRALAVVVVIEFVKFPCQVERISKWHVVKVFAPDGANNPFDERVGHWGGRNRFDLLHFQYSQVSLPAMRFTNISFVNAKPNDAAALLVHDDKYRVRMKRQ